MNHQTYKVIFGAVGELEAMLNEAAEEYQFLGVTWHLIDGGVWGTALGVNKRELRPSGPGLALAPGGRGPFGS